MLKRLTSLLLVLVLATPGCGREKKVAEISRNEVVPVELGLVLSGDVNLRFKERVNSRFIVRRTGSKEPGAHESQVVGTEPVEPVPHGNARFLAGAAIIPYTGDGKYTIPVGSINDAKYNAQQAVGSSIKVEWWPTGDLKSEPEVFLRRARPCEVEIKRGGTRGTVNCPDVTNEQQTKHFAMTLEWVAPMQPAPSVPAPTSTP